MGADISNFTFKASRKKYNLIVYIKQIEDNYILNLEAKQIQQFQYVNELNQLYPTGELVYVDTVGKMINYINKCNVILDVSMAELIKKTNDKNMFGLEDEDPDKKLVQQFLVTNIEILGRDNATITYKLHLIGINYLLLNCPIEYSTYNDKKKSVVQLIHQCLVNNDKDQNMIFVGKSFDSIQDETTMHFAAKANDTAVTAIQYLLSKFYYFDNKSTSMKFIYYDNMKKQKKNEGDVYGVYELLDLKTVFDINDQKQLGHYDTIVLSMFKTAEESYIYNRASNLGTVVKAPKTLAYKTFFTRDILTYSYAYNNMLSSRDEVSAIARYANTRSDSFRDESLDKYYPFRFTTKSTLKTTYDNLTPKLQKAEAFWNNDYDIYDSLFTEMTQDNALIVRLDGNICRIPGSVIQILIPPDSHSTTQQTSVISYQDENDRYKQLGGLWIVSKVRHIVSPAKGLYEQNITMFKNYLEKQEHMKANANVIDNMWNLNGSMNSYSQTTTVIA